MFPRFGWVPPRKCSVVFLEEWTGGLTSVGCEHSFLGFFAKEGCLIQLALAQHWSTCSYKHHRGSDDQLSPLLAVHLTQSCSSCSMEGVVSFKTTNPRSFAHASNSAIKFTVANGLGRIPKASSIFFSSIIICIAMLQEDSIASGYPIHQTYIYSIR